MQLAVRAMWIAALCSAACVSAFAQTPQVAKAEQIALMPRLEQAQGVVIEGATKPTRVLYAFLDANCMYCSYAWKALQAYEKAGLQVRWLLVAYQKDSSMPRAAAILRAADRVAALRENESGYAVASFDGAIKPLANPDPALAAMVDANNQLMDKMRLSGTPAFAWRDDKGVVHTLLGMPRLAQLPAITGLPEQKIDTPDLARFR